MSYVNSISSVLVGALFPLSAIGVSAFGLTLASRRRSSSGLEALLAVAATIFVTVAGTLMILGGSHNAISGTATILGTNIPRQDELLTKIVFALLPLSTLAFGTIRAATLTSYRRSFPAPTFQRISAVILILTGVVSVAFFVAYVASCGSNVPAFFESNESRQSSCSTTFTFLAAFGLTDLILDAILLVLPIYPSWRLGFNSKEAVLLLSVLALGIFGLVSGALRTAYSFQLVTSATSEPLSVLSITTWWLFVELAMGLLVSNALMCFRSLNFESEVPPRRLDIEAVRRSPSRGVLDTWGTEDTASITSNKDYHRGLKVASWRRDINANDSRNKKRERNKSREALSFKKNVHFSPIVASHTPPTCTALRSVDGRPTMPARATTESLIHPKGLSCSLPRSSPPPRSGSTSTMRDKPRQSFQAYLQQRRQRSKTLPFARQAEGGKQAGAQNSPPRPGRAFQEVHRPSQGYTDVDTVKHDYLKAEVQNLERTKDQIRATYGTPQVMFSPLVVPSQSELENWPLPRGASPVRSSGLPPRPSTTMPLSPGVLSRLEDLPTPRTPEYGRAETAQAVSIHRVQLTPSREISEAKFPLHNQFEDLKPSATAATKQPFHQPAPSAETIEFFYDPSKDSPICASPSALAPIFESTPSLTPQSTRSSDTLPAHLLLKMANEDLPPMPPLDGLATPLSPWPQTFTDRLPSSPSKHRSSQSLGNLNAIGPSGLPSLIAPDQDSSLSRPLSLHRPTRSLDDLWALPPLAQEEAIALVPYNSNVSGLPPLNSPPLHHTPYSATSSIFNFFRHCHDKSIDSTIKPLSFFKPHARTHSEPDPTSPQVFAAAAAEIAQSNTYPSHQKQQHSPKDAPLPFRAASIASRRRFSTPTSPPTPLPEQFPVPPALRRVRFRPSNIPIVNIQSPSPPRPSSGDFPMSSPPSNLAITALHGRGASDCSAVSTPGFFCRGVHVEVDEEDHIINQCTQEADDKASLHSATAHILDDADATPDLEQPGFTPPTRHTRNASSESITTPLAMSLPARYNVTPGRPRVSPIPFTFPDPMMTALQNSSVQLWSAAAEPSVIAIPGFPHDGKSDEQIFDEVRALRREREKILRIQALTSVPSATATALPTPASSPAPPLPKKEIEKEKQLTFAEALADERMLAAATDEKHGLLTVDDEGHAMRISVLDPVSPLDVDLSVEAFSRLRARVGMGRWSALGIDLAGV